jgi:hypothetical protein
LGRIVGKQEVIAISDYTMGMPRTAVTPARAAEVSSTTPGRPLKSRTWVRVAALEEAAEQQKS